MKVVQSAADIPESAGVSLAAASAGRIEGMYDPASDRIYLVADGLSSTDRAVWVAWHELFHRGVRQGQPGQALRQILNRAGLNKTINDLAKAILGDRGLDSGQRLVAVEEALAELNAADETGNYDQIQRRYGVTVPDSMKKGIRGHIARFVEAVKNVLKDLSHKDRRAAHEVFGEHRNHFCGRCTAEMIKQDNFLPENRPWQGCGRAVRNPYKDDRMMA